jgi:predicted ArsR family transcriptional regulator
MGDTDPRLDILKALGDNTRYAIYLELARSPRPLATAEISETLGLHPNTVRPHLERMRDVGLLEVSVAGGGQVGRPQHLYALASDAPGLGLEPPVTPMLASMLASAAVLAGVEAEHALEAGREQGVRLAGRRPTAPCVEATQAMHTELGFDPERVDGPHTTTIGFAHCPFGALAEANPDLICSLHRGLVEGYAELLGGVIVDFHDRAHREPCLVELR